MLLIERSQGNTSEDNRLIGMGLTSFIQATNFASRQDRQVRIGAGPRMQDSRSGPALPIVQTEAKGHIDTTIFACGIAEQQRTLLSVTFPGCTYQGCLADRFD